jgi:arylsulfatase A-like enzyme
MRPSFITLGVDSLPLLMAGPGIPAGHVVKQLVSHVDLFPTAVANAGGHCQVLTGVAFQK